jgi:hypothetical protein
MLSPWIRLLRAYKFSTSLMPPRQVAEQFDDICQGYNKTLGRMLKCSDGARFLETPPPPHAQAGGRRVSHALPGNAEPASPPFLSYICRGLIETA